jgi:hypothetical protein
MGRQEEGKTGDEGTMTVNGKAKSGINHLIDKRASGDIAAEAEAGAGVKVFNISSYFVNESSSLRFFCRTLEHA